MGQAACQRSGPGGGGRTHDAENPPQTNTVPLLTIDVWEHAYDLDDQNERARYVATFLDHVIDWRFAEENVARATT